MMQLHALDLNQLAILNVLLETESIQATAKRVGLTPSAVSHALARLRDTLQDPLLVRAGQRMVMTERARRLRPELAAALQALAHAIAPPVAFDSAQSTARFVFACTDMVEFGLLRPLGARLRAQAPGIDLQSRAPAGQVALLRDGEVDLGVGVFSTLPPDMRREVLYREHFLTLMRSDHPAATGPWTREVFAGLEHVLVAPSGIPRGVLDSKLESLGLTRRIARVVGSFLVAPFVVADGDLVVTLPSAAALALARELDLVTRVPPEEIQAGFDLEMVWHRRQDSLEAHAWLREQVRETALTVADLESAGVVP